jgi:acylpyruvate hydrolase
MRVATLRTNDSTRAVLVTSDSAIEIAGVSDVGALLALPDWQARAAVASGEARPLSTIEDEEWAPVVPRPGKIVCVGLNYRTHILEMGRELPEFPTLFAKYPEALVGPFDPIVLPRNAADAVDWEAELAVIVGTPVHRASEAEAAAAIAGYSVINDVTMRDFQYRTPEWFQGKTFEATSPFGPIMVTPDEFAESSILTCRIDGETVQETPTNDLVFGAAALIAYISSIVSLAPGDVIATGTPGGVGHARTPARYLAPGNILETEVSGIGVLRNRILAED